MSTAARALNCYSTQAALRTQRDPNFDFNTFVRGEPEEFTKLFGQDDSPAGIALSAQGIQLRIQGRSDSCYIADGDGEATYTPIYMEFIWRLKQAAYDYAEERNLTGLPPALPLSLILDELFVSPVPDIGSILAHSRGRQLVTVGAVQTLKQAESLYGLIGKDFLTQWRSTLAYRGILDNDTLQALSLLSGTYWAEVEGRSQGRHPRTEKLEWTSNVSLQQFPRLTPEQIRLGHPTWRDGALLVRRDAPHQWVRAVPFFRDDPWVRVLVNSAEHAYRARSGFPAPPLARNGDYSHLEALGLADRYRALQRYMEAPDFPTDERE